MQKNINKKYGAVSFNKNSKSLNNATLTKMKNIVNEYYSAQSLLNKSKIKHMRPYKGSV